MTLFVDKFCGHIYLPHFVEIFCGIICGHFLLTFFVDTFSGHFLWRLFVATLCGHFLWTLFSDTFCGHFLGISLVPFVYFFSDFWVDSVASLSLTELLYFHQLGPLGRVGLVVDISVRLSVCLCVCPLPMQFFLRPLSGPLVIGSV